MANNRKYLADFDGGILADCFLKARNTFYDRMDEKIHAATYIGIHDEDYAEPEFTGKYLDICAHYYEMEGDIRALLKGMAVVQSIRENQREDGYLGGLAPGSEYRKFSVWNQFFTVYGLVRMYQATGNQEILHLAVRAADWIVDSFTGKNARDILDATNDGSQNISCLYAIGQSYLATGEVRYLEFMQLVIAHCETSDMNLLSFTDILKLRSRKGIEMLIVYLGVLQYGLVDNNLPAVEAAKRYWTQINDTQIRNVGNGTVKEVWVKNGNAPQLMPTEEKPNETCVAVGWMELSLALFYTDPQAKYLDAVEKTLYNHLLGSFEKNGEDFAYYQGNYGQKIFRTDRTAYQCCRYRGFTIFSYLKDYLYYYDGSTLIPILYSNSHFQAGDISVKQTTAYPAYGKVHFVIKNTGTDKELKLRIPGWCRECSCTVNGKTEDSFIRKEDYFVVGLPAGTTEVILDMQISVEKKVDEIQGRSYASFQYGPLLLAQDTHYGGELWEPIKEGDNTISRMEPNGQELVHFEIDGVHVVDLASACKNDPEKDRYSVFLLI
ncbi:MAG: glycoside hydrolase family 127 protein [Lachnospiraceae bacterium]|nr:glycoside hydrolase family 127 protein [Lachnospiraceae bacterium]